MFSDKNQSLITFWSSPLLYASHQKQLLKWCDINWQLILQQKNLVIKEYVNINKVGVIPTTKHKYLALSNLLYTFNIHILHTLFNQIKPVIPCFIHLLNYIHTNDISLRYWISAIFRLSKYCKVLPFVCGIYCQMFMLPPG